MLPSLFFTLTVLIALALFYHIVPSIKVTLALVFWSALQCILAYSGHYSSPEIFPPRLIVLGVAPSMLILVIALLIKRSRQQLLQAELRQLTLFSSIRVPIEISLYFLYRMALVPKEMTFEGNNLDIVSGLTALALYFTAFHSTPPKKWLLLLWNLVCLALLVNIVATAVMAFPSPLQRIAFEQPNVAVTMVPYVLLPTLLVPLVLFTHIVAIIQLLRLKKG